jgi:hypothetical protein
VAPISVQRSGNYLTRPLQGERHYADPIGQKLLYDAPTSASNEDTVMIRCLLCFGPLKIEQAAREASLGRGAIESGSLMLERHVFHCILDDVALSSPIKGYRENHLMN